MREIRLIEWLDSMGDHGWEPVERQVKELRPMHIYTAGFVLDEGEDYLTVVQSYDERASGQPHCDNVISIPKVAVLSSRTIEAPS